MKTDLFDLRAEWKEVAQKVDKIGTYIEGEEFKVLPLDERNQIELLYQAMRDYLAIIADIIFYEKTLKNDKEILGSSIVRKHGNKE